VRYKYENFFVHFVEFDYSLEINFGIIKNFIY